MKKVLVFGIFDGIHSGHINFFKQAVQFGDELVVAVGQDSASKTLKNKSPNHPLRERIRFAGDVEYVTRAVPGDSEQGSYNIVKKEKPDIVCLGYDQKELARDFEKWNQANNKNIQIKLLEPYNPQKYHNSLIRSQDTEGV